jgi:hypothetical protein
MPVNRLNIIFFLLVFLGSCIDPFQPDINESQEIIVINGTVTDQPGIHRVTVSTSTPYNDPEFNPVTGCMVLVEDGHGNTVNYSENDPGIYEANLEPSYLAPGRVYRLTVITPGNHEYQSDFDSMLACAPVDDIYYEEKKQSTADPGNILHGIQFYVDVAENEETSRNYRWLLEETWEYNPAYYADYVWRGGPVELNVSDSNVTCYMHDPGRELYLASTRFLTSNSLKSKALNYVSNQTPRLKIRYSLLVKQHSLTEKAYEYWNGMESQSGDAGGLYETQPVSTLGNICNVDNPEEKVLGCFYATQQQTMRLTLSNHFDFEVKGFDCQLDTIFSLYELSDDFPYYLFSLSPTGGPPYLWGEQHCFDCRKLGGTTQKPSYW